MNSREAMRLLRKHGFRCELVDEAHVGVFRPGEKVPVFRFPAPGRKTAESLSKHQHVIRQLLRRGPRWNASAK